MSTRATYGFEEDGVKAVYYIHHDGYPAGAAEYFKAAQNVYSGSAMFMDDFSLANSAASHTVSHESHGDTEYRYDAVGNMLRATKRINYGSVWTEFFHGTISGFIAQYIRA